MAFHFLRVSDVGYRKNGTPHPVGRLLPSLPDLCNSACAFDFSTSQESAMEQKLKLIEKMEEKSMSVSQVAEAISFDPMVLGLYLVKDAYPVPKRILDKLESALAN